MRKYFLISAVALLATSTAFATTDYAEVTAKATIEVATELDCGSINFGTIVVKQNNAASTVTVGMADDDSYTTTGDVISVSGQNSGTTCWTTAGNFPTSVTISDENSNTMQIDIKMNSSYNILGGTLHIPGNVNAGTYEGSFTVTSVAY